jgi:hypothetical protein
MLIMAVILRWEQCSLFRPINRILTRPASLAMPTLPIRQRLLQSAFKYARATPSIMLLQLVQLELLAFAICDEGLVSERERLLDFVHTTASGLKLKVPPCAQALIALLDLQALRLPAHSSFLFD